MQAVGRNTLLRLRAGESRLRTLVDDGQVALDAALADDVRIRIARLAPLERGNLRLRSVEDRVVRNQHVGAGFRDDVLEPPRRRAVGLEPETDRALRCDV